MTTILNELIKLDWLLYYNNGSMPQKLWRFDHSKVKNALQEYIRNSDELADCLLPESGTERKNLTKLINYEVFSVDVLNKPVQARETVVFFAKDSRGSTRTFGVPLSEISI